MKQGLVHAIFEPSGEKGDRPWTSPGRPAFELVQDYVYSSGLDESMPPGLTAG